VGIDALVAQLPTPAVASAGESSALSGRGAVTLSQPTTVTAEIAEQMDQIPVARMGDSLIVVPPGQVPVHA
jgi:hypothetical protein